MQVRSGSPCRCRRVSGGHSTSTTAAAAAGSRHRRRPHPTHAALAIAIAAYTQAAVAHASPIAVQTPPAAAPFTSTRTTTTRAASATGDERASPSLAATLTNRDDEFSSVSPPASCITPTPRGRKRGPIPPYYVNSDGQWVEDYGWTLRGKGTVDPAASPASVTGESATAMADHVPTGTSTAPLDSASGTEATHNVAGLGVDAAALSTSTSASASAPTATDASTTASATSSAATGASVISIPTGWQAVPRETNYYAVPLVIAMSVLVAVLVAISIFVSVIVRRKKRRRRKAAAARRAKRLAAANGGGGGATDRDAGKEAPGDLDAQDEKGWRGALDKVTGRRGRRKRRKAKRAANNRAAAAAAPDGAGDESYSEDDGNGGRVPAVRRRVRVTGFSATGVRSSLRWRRRRGGGGEEGDGDAADRGDEDVPEDERALTRSGTRSSAASIVEDTLTHRVAARLSSTRGAGAGPGAGASATAGPRGPAGTTTVFSRDARNASVISLTASALDRIASRSSHRSLGGVTSSSASIRSTSSALLPPPLAGGPEILFTPADDPTLPDHLAIPGSPHPMPNSPRSRSSTPLPPPIVSLPPSSSPMSTTAPPPESSFGAMIATDSLPAPGPPAYRPSSSTVQRTRRFADPDHAASRTAVGDEGNGGDDAVSRLGATRRRLRRLRRESEGTSTERGGPRSDEHDEGEWHWPGEKGRPLAGTSAIPAGDPFVEEDVLPLAGPSVEHDDDETAPPLPPPVDRSLFTAHIATDDKAVLARLRQQRERSPFVLDDEEVDIGMAGGSSSIATSASMPMPSAPPVADEADLDEDGFERYDFPTSSTSAAGKATTTSLLPAPPQRVAQVSLPNAFPPSNGADLSSASSTVPLLHGANDQNSSYFPAPHSPSPSARAHGKAREAYEDSSAARRDEGEAAHGGVVDEEDLPMYLPGSTGATEALRMASAPVDDDDDEEEDDGDWDDRDSATPLGVGGDERQEEGIV
ncbi:hypothetical protein JCM10908_004762 [Rhodotorula pacifica]|uniref:uncharacterized protein n=1 Tax=Rhodotorula pacifica TaxID=1495444 RepID=UPI00317AE6C8